MFSNLVQHLGAVIKDRVAQGIGIHQISRYASHTSDAITTVYAPYLHVMHPVTVRIPDATYRILSEEADESGRSMSEVVREYVEKGMEYDELERERDRLRAEKRTIIEQREEHTDLVRTVERQQSLAERKARAGLLTKTKWALFGMDDEQEG